MHVRRDKMVLGAALAVSAAGIGAYLYLNPGEAPWEETGPLVVTVAAVESPGFDVALTMGIDDVRLVRADGQEAKVSVVTRRMDLTVSPGVHILLDAGVPLGAYTGIRCTLTSPEVRNEWQGDTPPEPVRLFAHDLYIPLPFSVADDPGTVLLLGFETGRAIHTDDKGERVLMPVVHVEVRDGATIETSDEGLTLVAGGMLVESATFGMDRFGAMRRNYRSPGITPSQESMPNDTPTIEGSAVEESAPIATTTSEAVETQASSSDATDAATDEPEDV